MKTLAELTHAFYVALESHHDKENLNLLGSLKKQIRNHPDFARELEKEKKARFGDEVKPLK